LLAGLSSHSYAAADAKVVTTEYLSTEVGMYAHMPDGTWNFEIWLSPTKTAPGGGSLYLLASFQNPQGGKPLISTAVVPTGTRQRVILRSGHISGMRDGHAYLVTVRVFADKAHTKLLGTHEQPIVYHQPPA
ncbi:MAG: hypothetical protein INR62_10665, partial [Rhodospirillales bacterium]|nr:hypothetical protein [Acetobacter sp.]